MRKDWVRVFVALVLLIGLTGYVAWHRKKTFQKVEQDEKAKRLIAIDFSKLSKITITNDQGSLVLEKRPKKPSGEFDDVWNSRSKEFSDPSEWAIQEPFKTLPEAGAVKTLIDNLKEFESTKVIDEAGETNGTYGIKNSKFSISLFEKGENKPKETLTFGDQNSAHNGIYVGAASSPKIYLASMALEYLRSQKANDLADKLIVGWKDFSNVVSIAASYHDGAFKSDVNLKRTEEGWRLDEGKGAFVDAQALDKFTNSIKGLRGASIVSWEAEKEAKTFGFDTPFATIKISDRDGFSRTLLVGGKIQKDKDIYIRRTDSPEVFSLPFANKLQITKTDTELVDLSPIRLAELEITGFEIKKDKTTWSVSKNKGQWTFSSPWAGIADTSKVQSVVEKLSQLKATEFLGSQKKLSGASNFSIRVDSAKGPINLSGLDRDDDKPVELMRQDPVMVYRISRDLFKGLMTEVSALKVEPVPTPQPTKTK